MERYNSNKVCRDKRQAAVTKYIVDTIQDFLCNLGMKPHMHLVEIKKNSLNNVIARLTIIIKDLHKAST